MPNDPNISRRELLRGRFLGGLLRNLGEAVGGVTGDHGDDAHHDATPTADRPATQSARYRQPFPVLRPPGAIEEQAFLEGCTRCDACIDACPHDAIVHAPLRFRGAAGTPMIDPLGTHGGGPCQMCDDLPCVTACEPDVLRLDMPTKMGIARIDRFMCLAHTGSFCTVCSEQCPVDGAIEVTAGKPRIIEETCTGCGVCQHVCPAPGNAVLLMPVAERPLPVAGGENDDAEAEGSDAS